MIRFRDRPRCVLLILKRKGFLGKLKEFFIIQIVLITPACFIILLRLVQYDVFGQGCRAISGLTQNTIDIVSVSRTFFWEKPFPRNVIVQYCVHHRRCGFSGVAHIHIFVFCPTNFFWNWDLHFKIDCFYSLWTRIYEYGRPQLSIFWRPWYFLRWLPSFEISLFWCSSKRK